MRNVGLAGRVLGLVLVAGGVTAATMQGPDARGLERLTVPESVLPPGCRLRPAPSRAADAGRGSGSGQVSIVSGSLFPANPWIGDDRRTVALIRRFVDPPPPEPDGPPPSRRESARYLLASADGVAAAYHAEYLAQNDTTIDVYAVRFETEALAAATQQRAPSDRMQRIVRGNDVIVVSARSRGADPCFAAIRDHVALQNPPAPPEVELLVRQALEDVIATRKLPDHNLLRDTASVAIRDDMRASSLALGRGSLPRVDGYEFRLVSEAAAQAESDTTRQNVHYITVDRPSIDGDTATLSLGVALLVPRDSNIAKLCCCTALGQFRRMRDRWTFVKWLRLVCA